MKPSRTLESLALDIFSYFGLGCRNVSKLFVPEGYPWEGLFPHFNDYAWVADHNKYRNNFDYQKSILLINGIHHLDNGFMLLREDMSLISPVSVVNYEYYKHRDQLLERISLQQDELQCIVASGDHAPGAVPFGRAQYTELWDYADGADVMDFLLNIPG